MKFPTLFGKIPKHQKFSFEPRYYDAKKEEMLEREARIRAELEAERGEAPYRSRIAGAFRAARKRSAATKGELNSALVRLGILLFLAIFIVAYLQWGKVAMYGFLAFIPFYLWLKLRK